MSFVLLFEVMDKEPTILSVWSVFLFFGLLGFFLSLVRSYLSIIGLVGTVLFAFGLTMEFLDPSIGKYIWAEDPNYIPQAYTAMALGLILPVLGTIYKLRKGATPR
jgi:hypothetical protein